MSILARAIYNPSGSIASSVSISVDNTVPRYDGTTGLMLQSSGVSIDDSDNMTVPGNLVVTGNLTVNGTTTTLNVATLDVEDKNILTNKGGTTALSAGSGLNIEGDAAAVVGYFRVATDTANLELKASTGSILTVDVNANKTLTVAGALNIEADSLINQDVTSDADVTFATLTVNNSGIHILDTNASHDLILAVGSDLTADRTLTFTTGDAARIITLSGNPTLADWFDQEIKTTSSPTFAGATFSGLTASELVATNGSKALVSLAVATYPSLTELTYVKGVTSAIQTQLDNKQPLDATLTSIAALGTAADKLAYTTGVDTWAETAFTAAARTVLDDTTVAAMVDTLGGASSSGTGGLVRITSAVLVTPNLGTPSAGVLTNCTGYVEANVVFTDVTTNDSSTTKHGFLKKLSNVSTEYMSGTGVWSTPSAAAASGMVVQMVNTQSGAVATGTTTIPNDDTIPQNTEGTEFMTRAITPTNTANLLRIDIVFNGSHTINEPWVIALFQDTTANALAAIPVFPNPSYESSGDHKFTHWMTAGTTSSTTFKVRAGPSASGTLTFNGVTGGRKMGGVLASSITVTEIKA